MTMRRRFPALGVSLAVLIVGLSTIMISSRPGSAYASTSGNMTVGAYSHLGDADLTLPFTFGTNSVYTVACGLQLSGGDSIQHAWWSVRVDTPGVGPGFVSSAEEVFDWLDNAYVWTSVTATFTSQTLPALLRIVNRDPYSQTYHYFCSSAYLTSVTSYSLIVNDATNTITIPPQSWTVFYTSASLPSSTLVSAYVGLTIDPVSDSTEIHTLTIAYMPINSAAYTADITRAQQYWENDPPPSGSGRLPLDLNLIGVNAAKLIVEIYNADTLSHSLTYDIYVWKSKSVSTSLTGSGSGTVHLGSQGSIQTLCISTPDSTKVYLVVPGVGMINAPDEAQGVQWGAYVEDSSGAPAAGTETVLHWWSTTAVHYETYPWRGITGTSVCQTILNDDPYGQDFWWNFQVYQFTG